MMVGSIFSVKPIEGVSRPCILSVLPKADGSNGILLDVGANADCKPEMLNQFAILGSSSNSQPMCSREITLRLPC